MLFFIMLSLSADCFVFKKGAHFRCICTGSATRSSSRSLSGILFIIMRLRFHWAIKPIEFCASDYILIFNGIYLMTFYLYMRGHGSTVFISFTICSQTCRVWLFLGGLLRWLAWRKAETLMPVMFMHQMPFLCSKQVR